MRVPSTIPPMGSTNDGILLGIGIACLLCSLLALRRLTPQQGKPASAWTSTELRTTVVTIGLMTLMIMGAAMVIRGLLG